MYQAWERSQELQKFVGIPEENHLGDLCIDGRLILKSILQRWGRRVCARPMRFSVRTSGRLIWINGYCKMRKKSTFAKQLPVSQREVCCKEFVLASLKDTRLEDLTMS